MGCHVTERRLESVLSSAHTSHSRHEVPGETDSLLHPTPSKVARFPCNILPARVVLAICSFAGFVNMFTLRMDLNTAILNMVPMIPMINGTTISNQSTGGLPWTLSQKNRAMAAFFYGYCATQILGGYLSGKFGGKRIFGGSILVTSVLTLLAPLSAMKSFNLFFVCRIGQGLAQGLGQPCMHSMWARWAPSNEKTKLLTISFAGCQLGTAIAYCTTNYLCTYKGWPLVFYVFGGAGVLWTVVWACLVYDSPSQHPWISQEEQEYIEKSVSISSNVDMRLFPWRILISPCFLAIMAAHFATDWGTFAVTNYMPTYLSSGLKYTLDTNGFLSSIPSFILLFVNPLAGYVADSIRARDLLSTKNTRKLMNSIGLIIPAALMIGVCQSDSNRILTLTLMILALAFTGFTVAGYSINHLDIAPPYAGLLFGLTNTVGTTSGFLGPIVLDKVVHDERNLHEWRIYFYITAGIFFTGGVIFAIFARGEPEPCVFPLVDCEGNGKPQGSIEETARESNRPSTTSGDVNEYSYVNEIDEDSDDDVNWRRLSEKQAERAENRFYSNASLIPYGSIQ